MNKSSGKSVECVGVNGVAKLVSRGKTKGREQGVYRSIGVTVCRRLNATAVNERTSCCEYNAPLKDKRF